MSQDKIESRRSFLKNLGKIAGVSLAAVPFASENLCFSKDELDQIENDLNNITIKEDSQDRNLLYSCDCSGNCGGNFHMTNDCSCSGDCGGNFHMVNHCSCSGDCGGNFHMVNRCTCSGGCGGNFSMRY